MKLIKESLIVFFWVMVIMGSLGSIVVSYFIFCERYGILWPTVGLVWFYVASVLIAWLNEKIRKGGKKREVPDMGTDSSNTGSTGGVVKLRDDTVATAILSARKQLYRHPDATPDDVA